MEGNTKMKELAKRFIDKECLITAFDSNHQFEGVIKEVSDSAILVEKKEAVEETQKMERKGYNLHAQFPTKRED